MHRHSRWLQVRMQTWLRCWTNRCLWRYDDVLLYVNFISSRCDLIYLDINECKLKGYCQGGQCTNTIGSYTCSCPPGFDLSSDGKQCLGITEEYNIRLLWLDLMCKNNRQITTNAAKRECALTEFASTWTDRSSVNAKKDTLSHRPVILASVSKAVSF